MWSRAAPRAGLCANRGSPHGNPVGDTDGEPEAQRGAGHPARNSRAEMHTGASGVSVFPALRCPEVKRATGGRHAQSHAHILSLIPVSRTLFGIRVFADVIRDLELAGVLIRDRRGGDTGRGKAAVRRRGQGFGSPRKKAQRLPYDSHSLDGKPCGPQKIRGSCQL